MHVKKIGSLAAAAVMSLSLLATPVATAQSSSSGLSEAFNLSSKLSSALSTPGSTPSPSGSNKSSTVAQRKTVAVAGQGIREYLIELPANYSPEQYVYPVVFGFGGWQHSAEEFRSYADLESPARGAIRIYPEARANSQGQGWEGPKYAPTSRGQDVAFVRAIYKQLQDEGYSPSRQSVFATGLSNGGGMALALACQASDLVTAVAVVSSANYTPLFNNCSGRVPTLFIHGTNDNVAPYYSDGSNAHGGSYYSARNAFRRIGQRNLCNVDGYMNEITGNGYTRFDYQGCDGQVSIARVSGGEHTWFPSNPDAADVAWDFMYRETR